MAQTVTVKGVEEIENVWIPMKDGRSLAARIFIHKSAYKKPVPAILEYIPYRKRDLMRHRDEGIHRYFASKKYASVRVDIRGTGDSEGTFTDEYTKQEHEDAIEIIDWLSKQKWCDGNIGMMGISWGGFNSLQVAALKPPALKAIITACSTDDRYADDVHYMGGCLLNQNMEWGSVMTLYSAMPPDPRISGDKWREIWKERLNNIRPLTALWLENQVRNAYWKHGSVCENYDAITIPVYAVGGWADGYSNAIPRLMQNLKGPAKGLIGPWAHSYPHDGTPGPAIGFLQEATRWWDHWLKGIDTGIMAEPKFRLWVERYQPPARDHAVRIGRWIAENKWPSDNINTVSFKLAPGTLSKRDEGHDEQPEVSFTSPQTVGLQAPVWCGIGDRGEMPDDQRIDDIGSLVFDTAPLEKGFDMVGAPLLKLRFRSNKTVANVAARISCVAPDGSVLRVKYGVLNLTHRNSHENPEFLKKGKWYEAEIKLNDIAFRFSKGHKLRLALSTSYWPVIWPAPEPVKLTIAPALCELQIPERPKQNSDLNLPAFKKPLMAATGQTTALEQSQPYYSVGEDLVSKNTEYYRTGDCGELGGASRIHIHDIDTKFGYQRDELYAINKNDPLSAKVTFNHKASFEWPNAGASAHLEFDSSFKADRDNFYFKAKLHAKDDKSDIAARTWDITIPRNKV